MMVADKDANHECLQDDVAAAEPSIDEKTAKLVSKGRWTVPGYKVCTTHTTTNPPDLQTSIPRAWREGVAFLFSLSPLANRPPTTQETFGDLSIL
jgi:hypothetical protein